MIYTYVHIYRQIDSTQKYIFVHLVPGQKEMESQSQRTYGYDDAKKW